MSPALTSYFSAMTEAGATLFGLLFVAISIRSPGGSEAQASVEVDTLGDAVLMALGIGFAISASALVPGVNLGYVAFPMSALGTFQATRVAAKLVGAWRRESGPRRVVVWLRVLSPTIAALFIGAIQLVSSARIAFDPGGEVPYRWLGMSVLGEYGVALLRSWMLIGGARSGLRSVFSKVKHPTPEA